MVKFPYNEKILVDLIYENREKFGGVTTKAGLIIWSMCSNIIDRGIRFFRKTLFQKNENRFYSKKTIYSDDDIANDLFVNVFCDVLVKYKKEKGTFRYFLNNAVNYRISRLILHEGKSGITRAENLKLNIEKDIHLNIYDNRRYLSMEYDFLDFDLKNCGFTDMEINLVKDLISGYKDKDIPALCLKYNTTSAEFREIKKRIKKIYSD